MRQRRQPIRLIALLVTLLFVCLPKIVQAGPLSSPLISSYNPPFAQENTWDKLQTFSAGLTVSGGNLIAPTIIGGTGTTSTLTLQSTSGVGAAGADIIFKVGNNGATEAGRVLDSGRWGMGISPLAPLHVYNTTSGFTPIVRFSDDNSTLGAIQYFEWRSGAVNNKIHGIAADGNGLGFYRLNDAGTAFINTNPDIGINPNGFVVLGTTTAASLLDLRAGDLTFSGANGQKYVQGYKTELTTIAAAATTATTITIPANAILKSVGMRVTVQPPGTATMVVTATTSGTVLQQGANMSTAINTTDVGTRAWGTNYVGVAAQTITITPNATPSDATGRVRFDIYYDEPTAPTS